MSQKVPAMTSLREAIAIAPTIQAGEAFPWEQPIPLDAAIAPPMTESFLPSTLGAFAFGLAEATETPMPLALLAVLAAASTAAAGRARVQLNNDYSEPLNVWTLTALEAGNRKSPVHNQAFAPLRAWEQHQAEIVKSCLGEALDAHEVAQDRINLLKRRAAKVGPDDRQPFLEDIQREKAALPPLPRAPQLLVGDVTPEKLAISLSENDERICLASDEGGIFATIAGRYSGVPNFDIWLQSFSGSPVRVDRIGREPITLHAPVLTMALATQPAVIKSMPLEFLHRGFLDRFFVAMPASPVGYRSGDTHPIPPETKQAYQELLYRLLQLEAAQSEDGRKKPHVIHLSEEAHGVWKQFSRDIEKEMRPGCKLEYIKGWASKLPGNLARVAGIFHLVVVPGERPWQVPLAQDTMEQAFKLVTALIPHALLVFDAVGADADLEAARHVLAWLKRADKNTFSARDSLNALKGRYKRMEAIRTALRILEDRRYIRELPAIAHYGRGRPKGPVYEVSPLAWESMR